MTNIRNKKLLFVAILPIIVVVTIASVLFTNITQDAHAVQAPTQTLQNIPFNVVTEDSFLANGGRSIVKVETPVKEIQLTRGNTIAVDLHIRHVSGSNPFQTVNVKVSSPNGYIWYPPSIASSTTEEQRIHAAETGILIPGSIDLGKLVTFSQETPVSVRASDEQIVKMYVSLPKDLPDDVVGHGAFLNVPIQVTDSDRKSGTVFYEDAGVNFQVVG